MSLKGPGGKLNKGRGNSGEELGAILLEALKSSDPRISG